MSDEKKTEYLYTCKLCNERFTIDQVEIQEGPDTIGCINGIQIVCEECSAD